jgi:hypothetical protein
VQPACLALEENIFEVAETEVSRLFFSRQQEGRRETPGGVLPCRGGALPWLMSHVLPDVAPSPSEAT